MTLANFTDALRRAHDFSPFLHQLLERQPELAVLLANGDTNAAFAWRDALAESIPNIPTLLRKEKQANALILAIGDLAGHFPLETVIETLSDFADSSLDRALADVIQKRTPDAFAETGTKGFAIIGLGKHGSRELNYSSDVDPIFIYDPETLPRRAREEPADAANRIGRQLIASMSERDGDGYVFRVDMRLRPTPEISPLVLPINAAISYYESSALAWEQAAFIRSRAAAGDIELGEYFLDAIKPFIWRRSLDYGAIKNISAVSQRIRDHYAGGQAFGPGYDLKRGRGGIREVEFFAQVHQLIHGGRDQVLREPATQPALTALAKAGLIGTNEAELMTASYRLYRTIEHRLQMVNDQQTHSLPDDDDGMDRVARLHGLDKGDELLALLAEPVEQVGTIYDGFIDQEESTRLASNADRLSNQLVKIGFEKPEEAMRRIVKWRGGQSRSLRSEAARSAFEEILAALMAAIAVAPDPVQALGRLDNLIERLPSAINFFHLLEARPALLAMVGDILSYAPVLADALGQRPELLDGLIDATALDLPKDVNTLAQRFGRMEPGDDYQMLLDRVRARVAEKRFALGVQLIEGRQDPLDVSGGYARVAEAAIEVLTAATIKEFEEKHGRIKGSELLILALGRLGGEALTHASDLDLIFVYTGEQGGESDGARSLGAAQYYNRLAQRVVAALSVPTASGPLYEVDTRLRPSGAQGMLAITVDAFEKYQREEAWTWEHMALTRARPVFGSAAAREQLQGLILSILSGGREREPLRKDVRKMRLDIVNSKPPKGPLDAKMLEGGLVDWEFIVHFAQLQSGKALVPQLGQAISMLVEWGILDAKMSSSYDLMARLLVTLRLVSPDCEMPPLAARALIAQSCGAESWDKLLASFEAARQSVIDQWGKLLLPDQNVTNGEI